MSSPAPTQQAAAPKLTDFCVSFYTSLAESNGTSDRLAVGTTLQIGDAVYDIKDDLAAPLVFKEYAATPVRRLSVMSIVHDGGPSVLGCRSLDDFGLAVHGRDVPIKIVTDDATGKQHFVMQPRKRAGRR